MNAYFPESFKGLWESFESLIDTDQVVSVREVRRELPTQISNDPWLEDWLLKQHTGMFKDPSPEEAEFVRTIFKVQHFQAMLSRQAILQGRPVADPWVVASGLVNRRTVVTQEGEPPNGAKIPNVCRHFEIDCIDLQEFMSRENWRFGQF